MNRMTLEQANEHFKLQWAATFANEHLAKAKNASHQAEYTAMQANAALYNFEADLEKNGIDFDENS
jgi:hypothetical protein